METFAYSDYVVREKVPSQYVRGKFILVEVGFKCPRCGKMHPPMEHFGKCSCHCGLNFQLHGNGLSVSGKTLKEVT